MPKFNRIFIIILDGAGCGVQNDYKKYHEHSSNTLLDTIRDNQNLRLPNLEKIGLTKIITDKYQGEKNIGTCAVMTAGNDTFSSVWEIMGVIFKKRFRSEKSGFDKKTLKEIETKLGTKLLGNEYISGHIIIEKYFDEHKKTRTPILYFAEDGIVLLTAHKNIVSIKRLTAFGEKLAKILKNKNVIRIITRPFDGKKGELKRIEAARKDFITNKKLFISPILASLKKSNVKMYATTHIHRVLNGDKIIKPLKNHACNLDILESLSKLIINKNKKSISLVCLQDFDTAAHKKDSRKYAKKLIEFDKYLKKLLNQAKKDDLFIITADHGCNPTDNHRYHTREIVPLIFCSKDTGTRVDVGKRKTLSDIGQIVAKNFSLKMPKQGSVPKGLFDNL